MTTRRIFSRKSYLSPRKSILIPLGINQIDHVEFKNQAFSNYPLGFMIEHGINLNFLDTDLGPGILEA